MQEYDNETYDRLSYLCNYSFHYDYVGGKEKALTWLDILENHYRHFVDLLSIHVSKDSDLFRSFFELLQPEDQTAVLKSQENLSPLDRFLNYKCMHNSRMKGKTWRFIREKKYPYYLWSVANTMSRTSRTFNALVEGLKPEDKELVLQTEKGKFKVPPSK